MISNQTAKIDNAFGHFTKLYDCVTLRVVVFLWRLVSDLFKQEGTPWNDRHKPIKQPERERRREEAGAWLRAVFRYRPYTFSVFSRIWFAFNQANRRGEISMQRQQIF